MSEEWFFATHTWSVYKGRQAVADAFAPLVKSPADKKAMRALIESPPAIGGADLKTANCTLLADLGAVIYQVHGPKGL